MLVDAFILFDLHRLVLLHVVDSAGVDALADDVAGAALPDEFGRSLWMVGLRFDL